MASDIVLMAEVAEETTYAAHHEKKSVLVFSAMRHFAEKLRQVGWKVDYIKLDDSGNWVTLGREITRAAQRNARPARFLLDR